MICSWLIQRVMKENVFGKHTGLLAIIFFWGILPE